MIFPEVSIFKHSCHSDARGDLWTIWQDDNIRLKFNHDKVSTSYKNVLRGLHCDSKSWKLITCLYGVVQLVVVDYNKNSENYLKSDSIILSLESKTSVLIPPMFANGHLVLGPFAVFHYKWSYPGDYPDVDEQYSLNWADPKLNINWLCKDPILSDRDRNSKFLD